MRLRSVFVYALGLTCAASIVACGGGGSQETSSIPAAAPGAVKIDPATAGDIKGMVTLEGMAPKNDVIKMNADPVCLKQTKGEQAQETYMVGGDGKSLGNVFVYVKDGLGHYIY